MRVNVDKVLERDQKLSELDQRAGLYHRLNNNKRFNKWFIIIKSMVCILSTLLPQVYAYLLHVSSTLRNRAC